MGISLLRQGVSDELNIFAIDGGCKRDCSGLNCTTERGADDGRYPLLIWKVISELAALALTLVGQEGITDPGAVLHLTSEC